MTPFDLRVMGLLLRQGRRLNGVSMGLAALAAAWLALQAVAPSAADATISVLLGASLLAAGAQLYCAIRTDFDADLFVALSDCPEADAARMLDAGLQALGLRAAGGPERGWPERWRGARAWMRRQALALALQLLLLTAAWFAAG